MVDQVGHDVSGVSETTMASLHIELQRCAPALDMFLICCISFYGSDVSFPSPISYGGEYWTKLLLDRVR